VAGAGDSAAGLIRCADLLKAGAVAEAAALFLALDPGGLGPAQVATRQAIGMAILAAGDPETAALLPMLDAIPQDYRPDLRYCALLMQRRTGQAARFRRRMTPGAAPRLRADWRWSLALAALKRGHLRAGMALYPARFHAINRTETAPSPDLVHVPMAERRLDAVFLEQGLGDTLLHLAQLKALRGAEPLTILGAPRWRPAIARWFPGWTFRAIDPAGTGTRIEANAAGDVLALALAAGRGGLRPAAPIAEPHRAEPARIGLIWRAGTHPNRPAERRMTLDALRGLLPDGGRFLALQHDMTPGERAAVAADPRIDLPAFDPVLDIETLVETVAGLAGVLGVDGSAVHVAGVCGVPVCVLMNPVPHWYWGRAGRAAALYPKAATLSLVAPDRARLRRWCGARLAAHARRRPGAAPLTGTAARPVLVTGPPWGGGGAVLSGLAARGLWTGAVGRDGRHPLLGDQVTGRLLELFLDGSADGIERLPETVQGFAAPQLARVVARALARGGHPGGRVWGMWDHRLALTWPLWDATFPDAVWVICDPGRAAVAAAAPPAPGAAWARLLHEAYGHRLAALAAGVPGRAVRTDGAAGDAALDAIAARAGLDAGARPA
jgi:hypothetical protein